MSWVSTEIGIHLTLRYRYDLSPRRVPIKKERVAIAGETLCDLRVLRISRKKAWFKKLREPSHIQLLTSSCATAYNSTRLTPHPVT